MKVLGLDTDIDHLTRQPFEDLPISEEAAEVAIDTSAPELDTGTNSVQNFLVIVRQQEIMNEDMNICIYRGTSVKSHTFKPLPLRFFSFFAYL